MLQEQPKKWQKDQKKKKKLISWISSQFKTNSLSLSYQGSEKELSPKENDLRAYFFNYPMDGMYIGENSVETMDALGDLKLNSHEESQESRVASDLKEL